MRLELTGRHIAITPALRKLVEQRLQHVSRMMNSSAVSAQVVLTQEKTRVHADLTLHARGEKFLHGEATGRDVSLAFGAAADRIDRQAQRVKEKWKDRRRAGVSLEKTASAAPGRKVGRAAADRALGAGEEAPAASRRPRLIRERRYAVKPMTIEDAAAEIDDRRDAVIVFRNSGTDAVTVLFRRSDGNLGLIEPEV
ncbi:MAG TPA: ribosome-associated translation inhibitor RaiA [Vicinamibacterales bacterium]|nr:ribosome-associated translation inhibitor RaiA [Vicinamibacterales bacterium]